ncbi:hypothetical protein KAR91_45365 [Candidatus Pacearchaeota archaeon]|nr:hypothetical protein [Candidatus Pacearchaeota archaeon]
MEKGKRNTDKAIVRSDIILHKIFKLAKEQGVIPMIQSNQLELEDKYILDLLLSFKMINNAEETIKLLNQKLPMTPKKFKVIRHSDLRQSESVTNKSVV